MSALARNTDPSTSHAAAASVDVTKLQAVVVSHLSVAPQGLTTSDIAAAAGLPRDSISPRMKALVSKNIIRDSGRKETPVGMRRQQIVWEFVR